VDNALFINPELFYTALSAPNIKSVRKNIFLQRLQELGFENGYIRERSLYKFLNFSILSGKIFIFVRLYDRKALTRLICYSRL
jgi:hypothetical protein